MTEMDGRLLVQCVDGPELGNSYPLPMDYPIGGIIRLGKMGDLSRATSLGDLFDRYVFDGKSLRQDQKATA